MADAYSGMSIAVLNSAVRELHVYKYVPKKGSTVDLSFSEVAEVKMKYPRAIQVTEGAKMVGHVAAEHSNVVFRWLTTHPQHKVKQYDAFILI